MKTKRTVLLSALAILFLALGMEAMAQQCGRGGLRHTRYYPNGQPLSQHPQYAVSARSVRTMNTNAQGQRVRYVEPIIAPNPYGYGYGYGPNGGYYNQGYNGGYYNQGYYNQGHYNAGFNNRANCNPQGGGYHYRSW